jgi:6-pyruvoyltetrahydropterin/6-carboxytetrahydropterin synthase
MNELVAVYRKEHFNAAHRLHNPNWDEEKNKAIFGKCNNPNYHGHNYELIVKIIGKVDHATGYVIDLKTLSDLIQNHVVEIFDHKNLNEDCEAFKDLNPTAENIAIVIYNIMRPLIDASLIIQIKLYETPRNYVKYPAILTLQ